MDLTRKEARRLALHSQLLLSADQPGRGRKAVLKTIKNIAYVQIDTISVIERAHNHVLWTRVGNYSGHMLDELQWRFKEVFEYWFHAAAYLPMRDYRFYLPTMQFLAGKTNLDSKLSRAVLDRIRAEGPLQSRDFEDKSHKSTGWWNWKPAKRTLEQLFLAGELMVLKRNRFQKVYDLRERVLPTGLDTSMPQQEEWNRFLILRMLSALGLAALSDITFIRSGGRTLFEDSALKNVKRTLMHMVEEGEVLEISFQGQSYFTTRVNLTRTPRRIGKKTLRFLSPFDNLVINRKRMLNVFDFDYQLECYVTAAKRKYGYFSLPILWGDQLIGRMDSKADRKSRIFTVKNLVLEPRFKITDDLLPALTTSLLRFASYNACDEVRIDHAQPAFLAQELELRFSS